MVSSPRASTASKAPGVSASTSSTASRSPSGPSTGTTISLRERLSQAIWPGKASTSSTTTVRRSRAAAPHTPRVKAMRRQPRVPW